MSILGVYLQCCDHPNLLDQSLQSFVTNIEENLDVGIKASGKLKALDKILLEIRNRGLRVLILFQVACLIVLIYIYIYNSSRNYFCSFTTSTASSIVPRV